MKFIYYGISVAGEENSQEQRHISSMEVLDGRGMCTQIRQKYSQITMSSPFSQVITNAFKLSYAAT